MTVLLCAVSDDGAPTLAVTRARYAASPCFSGLTPHWYDRGAFTAVVGEDALGFGPYIAEWGPFVGIGMVRLDNRDDLVPLTPCGMAGLADLDLIVRLIATFGDRYIPHFLGDFAFLIWDSASRRLIAARDTFGVRPLYFARVGAVLTFASRADVLASGTTYDVQYLAERLAYCAPEVDRTVYAGVSAVPPASIARWYHGVCRVSRYWSPYDFEPRPLTDRQVAQLPERFRDLHAEAVRVRLTGMPDTWAHLSGGLDSSSIVSMAEWLARAGRVPSGIAGTVTWVDTHGSGADERTYSNAVVDAYDLRNEQLCDYLYWQDDGYGPPLLDQPDAAYLLYARDRRTAQVVRAAGGRVLLTGIGGDHLLLGSMFFFADWLVRGRAREAIREMVHRAAWGRTSFWELAYKNALLPLLPGPLRGWLIRETGRIPPWIPRDVVRRYQLKARDGALSSYNGRVGHKYADYVAGSLAGLQGNLPARLVEETLDVRHPYLHRPLVEFALQLPPEMCVRPHARKWILREAMRSILPDTVRTRIGKGALDGLMAWSIFEHRAKIERALRDPILAQLGCIDRDVLLRVVRDGSYGARQSYIDVQYTLAYEVWLQVRSGRWPTVDGAIHGTRNESAPRVSE